MLRCSFFVGQDSNPRPTDYRAAMHASSDTFPKLRAAQRILESLTFPEYRPIPVKSRSFSPNKRQLKSGTRATAPSRKARKLTALAVGAITVICSTDESGRAWRGFGFLDLEHAIVVSAPQLHVRRLAAVAAADRHRASVGAGFPSVSPLARPLRHQANCWSASHSNRV
jgi:hypothetical protein